MVKGFVFGKFLPFHKGHEAMIRFALTKCDFLTVLVCCSEKEGTIGSVRMKWIADTFYKVQNLEVCSFNYVEKDLPNTSVSSPEVSKIWSEKFKQLFPDYSLLVTSEEYGSYIAGFMGIKHIPFDPYRNLYPVSATSIRNNLFNTWSFLPDTVKSDLAIKVVLLGTESTGKTTLGISLAKHYNCGFVREAGRELIPDSGSFQFDDLSLVAARHAELIEKESIGNSPLIIIDTDIHITMSYAQFVFGKELSVDPGIYQLNKADLYLYLNHDAVYVQDGTRLSMEKRNQLDFFHRRILKEHNISIVEITGNWEQRFLQCVDCIDQLIQGIHRKIF